MVSARNKFNPLRVYARLSFRYSRLVTIAVHPNAIAGETPTPTPAPIAAASPDDLDKQHELGQFLTPNPVADFMASLFKIHRNEVLTLTR